MTKVEPPKGGLTKPPKPVSRLGELATAKVVSAGEAFERDLAGRVSLAEQGTPLPASQQASMPATPTPNSATEPKAKPQTRSADTQPSIKRTFRYPKSLDSKLKKLVHKFNLEKPEDEPELTMEEVGVIMAKHFLGSDPEKISREAHRQ